ncbi:MAG: ATP-binding cassette domain-containing protein [Candidatus Sumerlaeia bacterium]|nr:ATP-binding cassette domain-containing protein [Candidatus Sumerlaeia bacterium]
MSSDATASVLSIRGVDYAFGEGELRKQVLYSVDLEMRPGEIVILEGPSGSGKTTLLTLIGGLRRMQKGSLRVFGEELMGSDNRRMLLLRRRIGFIFQLHNLLPFLTARQNVELAFALRDDVGAAEMRRRSEETLAAMGLTDRIEAIPAKLSGGQKQRVAIARALAPAPDLILADEPTASLDKQSGRQVVDLLHQLARSKGIPILLVTHDNRILDVADRIIRMEDGHVTCDKVGLL